MTLNESVNSKSQLQVPVSFLALGEMSHVRSNYFSVVVELGWPQTHQDQHAGRYFTLLLAVITSLGHIPLRLISILHKSLVFATEFGIVGDQHEHLRGPLSKIHPSVFGRKKKFTSYFVYELDFGQY